MARSIEDLLHRRSDLSTFLVHLTRRTDRSARTNLLSILSDQTIEARSVLGMAASRRRLGGAFRDTQRVVCLTEAPLEQMWMLCESVEDRQIQLSRYGLVFTKSWGRRRGVNPVWYVDITRGHDWLMNPLNAMLDVALQDGATILQDDEVVDVEAASAPIARIAPFIEQMGNPAGIRKEFWWEREWRHVGDLPFRYRDLVAIVAPENVHEDLSEQIGDLSARLGQVRILDPSWGLERMIAALARVPEEYIGPFPS